MVIARVGGLLHATLIDTSSTLCLPCYDGNGNISAWYDGGNSSLIERREYDSFGAMVGIYRLSTNAALHSKLHYGFSTKWRDAESDLLYYGYRYYNPTTQRWLNRDPIEENGGLNLYGFVRNDGVNQWDLRGMKAYSGYVPYQDEFINNELAEKSATYYYWQLAEEFAKRSNRKAIKYYIELASMSDELRGQSAHGNISHRWKSIDELFSPWVAAFPWRSHVGQ
jgi:RHS repeat-associated protein